MHHLPKLTAPFYADPGDGTMLHRYLDEEFVSRFQEELAAGALKGTKDQAWRQTDRFGKYAKNTVCLRLPLHRTFYMVSSEISCDVLGNPAFDPAKIQSAGFVVRRGSAGNFHTWQVRQGKAIGWRKEAYSDLEPDHYKRLLNRKLIAPKRREPLYSGEQIHPLIPELADITDSSGRLRKHCILSGFLPLGGTVDGSVEAAENQDSNTAGSNSRVSSEGQLAEFEWPFGSWDGESDAVRCSCSGSLAEVAGGMCGHIEWEDSHGFQVDENGLASSAFISLLKVLLERYHIQDASLSENEALRTALSSIYFYDSIDVSKGENYPVLDSKKRNESLLSYLDDHVEDVLEWLAELENPPEPAEDENDEQAFSEAMPQNKKNLFVTQAQAASLRELLVLRSEQAERFVENSLALPRYSQNKDDEYFIVPFVRYLDDCGCEKITWGPASKAFRVVSPLDPEAVRLF